MKQLPRYDRPRTPPPISEDPYPPHKPCQEWPTPIIPRTRQMREDGKLATDVKQKLSVPPRTQRDMLKLHTTTNRRPGHTNRRRPVKIDRDTVHKMEKHIPRPAQKKDSTLGFSW